MNEPVDTDEKELGRVGIVIQVTFCDTDAERFYIRYDFDVNAIFDAPLLHSIVSNLPAEIKEDKSSIWMQNPDNLQCFESHYQGKNVELNQTPLAIPAVLDAIRNGVKPVLFLTDNFKRLRDSGISIFSRSSTLRLYSKSSDMLRVIQKRGKCLSKPPSVSIDESYDDYNVSKRQPRRVSSMDVISNAEESQTIPPVNTHQIIQKTKTLPYAEESQTIPSVSTHQIIQKTKTLPVFDSIPMVSSQDQKNPFRIKRREAIRGRPIYKLDPCDSKPKQIQVLVDDRNCSIPLNYASCMTVREIHAALGSQLSKRLGPEAMPFILTYSIEGTSYELRNSSQFMRFSLFHEKIMSDDTTLKGNIVVKFITSPSGTEKATLLQISRLIQVLFDKRVLENDIPTHKTIAKPDLLEVSYARRTLYDFVTKVTDKRDTCTYSLSPEVMTTGTPTIISLKIPLSNYLSVTFHYEAIFSFTRKVHIHAHASKILEEVFPCVVACGLVDNDMKEDYVLQVTGECSYIHGDNEFISFEDIRRSIMEGERIHLSIVKRPYESLYHAINFNKPNLDPNTTYVPLHSQLKKMTSFVHSSWNQNENIRLRLCHVENLGLSEINGSLSIEVSLHFGCKTICLPLTTKSINVSSFTAKWNEILEFNIKIQDIPKESKILVILRNGLSTKYHWGLLPLYDHEGRMNNDDYTLYLWEDIGVIDKINQGFSSARKFILEQENFKFMSILAGPATNNPTYTAVRAVVRIDYKLNHNIFYPSTHLSSREDFFEQGNKRNSRLSKHFSQHLRLKFIHKDKEPYSGLHKHLLMVHWDYLVERMEVYYLLDSLHQFIEEIPISVALRLLDSDFPDENVRNFATAILEKLSDNELQYYLLQLVQALKFESLHDSPLARFLLKRALNNKTIGHNFFWYLHCEMQCDQYTPRFAVILEAYLIGCGEAMMMRFKDQVEIQELLEEVGTNLSEEHGRDAVAMQAALPEALKKMNLNKRAFTPISNPRLTVGKLRPEKCKIISSAKRPMWLELINVTKSTIDPFPIRLIYKMGDDLRQDMITLKMLSLFDKLWKEEGLDMKLTLYGCMATNHRSGVIEVVKNAMTISEVSGVRDSTKLYRWIRSHQKNIFGEVDSELVEKAIKTFVHSCAGYSVATYTLGIGDRHNDNIMVTTSGNLFHIDFGHFLGNVKYFMKFKREWAPFVLTPDFIYVMGGEDSDNFKLYCHLCCRAFTILRKNADLIINLFSMMRSTGIPELTCVEDTDYIKNALVLEKTEAEAEECFINVIQKCMDLGWTVQIMWGIHNRFRHSSAF